MNTRVNCQNGAVVPIAAVVVPDFSYSRPQAKHLAPYLA